MKYSKPLSIICALLLIAVCFAPWVYIESIGQTITGMKAPQTNFGRPGMMNIFFSIVTISLILAPGTWPKRINVFICSFNFSWAIRNFLVTTQCAMGECPEKKWGIYALLVLSFSLLIFSLFPRVNMKNMQQSIVV